MSDEDIILVDEVDVSKCKECILAISPICNLVNGKTNKFQCYHYPDCYYKQLVRKTKESEELTNKLRQYEKALDKIFIEVTKYQALTLGKPITMRENDCLYTILHTIDEVKDKK